MNRLINCAGCGKLLTFGETYTSLEQTDDSGAFGLGVCGNCYTKELHHRNASHIVKDGEVI